MSETQNNSQNNDPILGVLEDTPTQANAVVEASSKDVTLHASFIDERDPAIVDRDKNINFAKDNIKDMIPAIAEAASDTLSVAKILSSADHASAGAALLTGYLKAQQTLVQIEKVHDDLRHRDKKGEAPQVQNQTLNVFAGTTAELQEIMKKIGLNDVDD